MYVVHIGNRGEIQTNKNNIILCKKFSFPNRLNRNLSYYKKKIFNLQN